MLNPATINNFQQLLNALQTRQPLIHCITNPISINDCANILLAIGARPIMAEHPAEVAEITATAHGLALNLGNITDARMASMLTANLTAKEYGIPVVIDLVGISCSTLRLNYVKKLLSQAVPTVLKGNITELRALLGLPTISGAGIDASQNELVTEANAPEYAALLGQKAAELHATLLATGPEDLIVNESGAWLVGNGTPALASITGTGCMLNVLVGAALSSAKAIASISDPKAVAEAVLLACLLLEIAGEQSQPVYDVQGPGSFHVELLNKIHFLTTADVAAKEKVKSI